MSDHETAAPELVPVALDGSQPADPSLWATVLLTAAAGGMGWGIRGQYGHETGAMVPGLLVGLVIGLLYSSRHSSLWAARLAALTAVGISFGGSMTYGQTLGLTQDPALHGNWSALGWGILGVFIKGGIWVGFAGILMGVGLGGFRYTALEVALLFLFLIGLHFLGIFLLNEPFEPADRQLPSIYFSGDWYWQPDKEDLRPRKEQWGGLLLALAGLWSYVAFVKRDTVARDLGLFGILFGGLGFAGGQCVQAYHSWNVSQFREGWFSTIEPYMNWWNTMETIFGAILGFGLGLGVWLCRRRLAKGPAEDMVELAPSVEIVLVSAHVLAVSTWSFLSFQAFDHVADNSLTMGLVPLILIVGGRYAPYLIALPVVALTIAGKTLRDVGYGNEAIRLDVGWLCFFVLPIALMLGVAIFFAWRGQRGQSGRSFARWSLLITSWLYFWLNFAMFDFPWPWDGPTGRTPSAVVFSACLVLLTAATLCYPREKKVGETVDRGR